MLRTPRPAAATAIRGPPGQARLGAATFENRVVGKAAGTNLPPSLPEPRVHFKPVPSQASSALVPVGLGSLGRTYASRMQVICSHRSRLQFFFHFILLRFRTGVESSETILLRRLTLRLINRSAYCHSLPNERPSPTRCACLLKRRLYVSPQPPMSNVLGPSSGKFLVRLSLFKLKQEKVQNVMVDFLTSMHSLFHGIQLRSSSLAVRS